MNGIEHSRKSRKEEDKSQNGVSSRTAKACTISCSKIRVNKMAILAQVQRQDHQTDMLELIPLLCGHSGETGGFRGEDPIKKPVPYAR